MIEGLFISASGMLPKATQHEAIANNLANAEVTVFKKDNLFMREVREAMKRQSGDYPDWRLNRFEGSWTDYEQAELRRTGDVFDLAIKGKGFFALQTPSGIQYTRNGNFSKNAQGQLVNPLGYPVLDQGGQSDPLRRRWLDRPHQRRASARLDPGARRGRATTADGFGRDGGGAGH